MSVTRAPTGRRRCRASSSLISGSNDLVAPLAVVKTRNLSCLLSAPSIDTVTPTSFSTSQSMISREQRRVRREAEVDFLADHGGALAARRRCVDLSTWKVEQRLAAEERQVHRRIVARLPRT